MADLSCYSFTGRLTKDAAIKTLPSGKTLLELDVANNIGFGDFARTNWLKVKKWGENNAGLISLLVKGSLITASGELSTETWRSNNGETHTNLVVTVFNIQILNSKKQDAPAQTPAETVTPPVATPVILKDASGYSVGDVIF